jgi:hypothetical protein
MHLRQGGGQSPLSCCCCEAAAVRLYSASTSTAREREGGMGEGGSLWLEPATTGCGAQGLRSVQA